MTAAAKSPRRESMTCLTPSLVEQGALARHSLQMAMTSAPKVVSNLDCGHAHSARAGVDENGSPLLRRATVLSECQAVMNTTGMRRRFFEGKAI